MHRWPTHGRVSNDARSGSRRRETRAGESDTVDLGATVAAVAGKAQRAPVLWMLTGADDRHGE